MLDFLIVSFIGLICTALLLSVAGFAIYSMCFIIQRVFKVSFDEAVFLILLSPLITLFVYLFGLAAIEFIPQLQSLAEYLFHE